MPTSDLSERVAAELVEFCWGQWTQMGVSGAVTRRDRWAADPEALLLFSLSMARHDPRLFDEILDWLVTNGRLISAQRIKNLSRQDPEARRLAGASLAWAADHSSALRPFGAEAAGTEVGEREPLFRAIAKGRATRKSDARFLSWGFARPPVEPSLKSRPPDLAAPVNLAFRLRLLLGVGTRSEVVRFLLVSDHPEVTTHQVARAAGFAKRNVSETLVALVDAGVVNARWRANERVFKTDPRRWLDLLHLGPREIPGFVDWICLFRALIEILRWLEAEAATERSDYLRASEARTLVSRIDRDLLAAGVTVPDGRRVTGQAYWAVFEEILEAALGKLRAAA